MNKLSTIKALIVTLGFLISPLQGFTENLTALNYAEAALALARGPLAALSYRNHQKHTKMAKAVHVTTDVVRIANELFTSSRTQAESDFYSSLFWINFDVANLALDFFSKDKRTNDRIELSQEQKEKINQLIAITQTCLLPSIESLSALYQAINIDNSQINCLHRQQAQALKSLARATSVYLNHRQSKAAIALLVGAISEVMYVAKKSISITNNPGNNDRGQRQNPEDDNFDAAFWQDPERDREEQRRANERQEQQRRNNAARADLQRQALHAPEIIRAPGEGGLIVRRNGVTRIQEASVEDPITFEPWQPGARVRVLACDHLILDQHTALLQGAQLNQCLLCNLPRVQNLERVITLPGVPERHPAPAQASRTRASLWDQPAPQPPVTTRQPQEQPFNPLQHHEHEHQAGNHELADDIRQVVERQAQEAAERARAQPQPEALPEDPELAEDLRQIQEFERQQELAAEERERQAQDRVERELEQLSVQLPARPINNPEQVQLVQLRNGSIGVAVRRNNLEIITPNTATLENFNPGDRVRIAPCGHAVLLDEDQILAIQHARSVARKNILREETCSQVGCHALRSRATEAVVTIGEGILHQTGNQSIDIDSDDD